MGEMARLDQMTRMVRANPASGTDRARAFRRAGRHSSRVWLLKRAIFAASVLGVAAIAGVTLLKPFGQLPAGVTAGQTTLEGTRITMELPRLSGFRKDGRSYEVRAASGVQDVRTPKVIELNQLEARVGLGDSETASATAPRGVFDSSRDYLQLSGDDRAGRVRITSTNGYEIVLKSADVDFRAGTVVSSEPVNVRLPNGVVEADTFRMSENGQIISFEGRVTSEIWHDGRAGPSAGRFGP